MNRLGLASLVFFLSSFPLFADPAPVEVNCKFSLHNNYFGYNLASLVYEGEAESGQWNVCNEGTDSRMMSIVPGERYRIYLAFYPDNSPPPHHGPPPSYAEYSISLSNPTGYRLMMTGPNGSEYKQKRTYAYQTGYLFSSNYFYITLVPEEQFNNGSADFGLTDGFSDHRPSLSIDMGPLQNGGDAGQLRMEKDFFSELTYTPEDLEYISVSPEVSVVRSSGKIRQIAAPAGLVDVVTVNTTTYKVSMYDWSSVGPLSGGTYTILGSPLHSYELKKLGTDSLQLKKTSGSFVNTTTIERSGSTITKYDWTSGSSANPKTDTLRKLETTVSASGGVETRTVKYFGRADSSASFVEAKRTLLKYKSFGSGTEAWGPVLTEREEGNGFSHSIKTTYAYYENSSDDGYRELKSVTRQEKNSLSYVTRYKKLYEYYGAADEDKVGLLKKSYEPFQDTLPSIGSSDGKVTSYTYSSIRYDERIRPTLVETKVNGTLVGKASYSYQNLSGSVLKTTAQNYASSGSSVSTETMNYNSTHGTSYLRGRPYSVKRADGTKTRFLYSMSGGDLTIDSYSGYSSIPSGYSSSAISGGNGPTSSYKFYVVPKQSTQERTVVDSKGRVVSVSSKVCDTGSTFATVYSDTYGYQTGGFLSSILRDGTTIYDAFWENDTLSSMTDASGKTTDYEYDSNGRPDMIVEVGGSTTTVSPHGYLTDAVVETWTEIEYDGANNVKKREVNNASNSETLVATFNYDMAGALTSKTLDCCDTVSYAYEPGQVTTTNADSGTVVEQHWKDGSLKSRTGTATTPLYAEVFVDSSAKQLVSQSAAQSFTSMGQLTLGYSQQRIDWLGRTVVSQVRNAKGTLTETVNAYDSFGRLSSTRPYSRNGGTQTALSAATRFTYNSLGQPDLQGLDGNNDGSLSATSASDRVSSKTFAFWKDGSSKWWAVEKTYAYPSTSGAVLASESKSRLSHYAGELGATVVEDSQGNATTTISFVNRSVGLVETESIFDPAGSGASFTESVAVSRLGRPVYSKSASGVERTLKYDALGRLQEEQGREDVRKVYSYHSGTRRLKQVKESSNGSGGLKTVQQYDYTHARVSKETRFNGSGDGGNAIKYYGYNQRGQRTHTWGTGTYPVKRAYDAYGRLEEQYQYRDSISGTTFSDAGKDYSLVEWTYGHSDGSLSEKRHFYSGASYDAESFEYNELGQLDKRISARSTSIYADYVYSIGSSSSTGDLTNVNYSDATPDQSYTYDRMGRVKNVTDATGTRTFNYNSQGGLALSSESLPDGFYGSGASRNLSYAYETAGTGKVAGRFSSVGYDGVSWRQRYDASNGRISSIDALGSGFSSTMAFWQSYHAASDLLHVAHYSPKGYKQERSMVSWTDKIWHSKTHFTGEGVTAHYRLLTLTTQNQTTYSQLDGNSDPDSLVARIRGGSTSTIIYNPDYAARGQLDDWDSSRTGGTDSDYAWDAAGNPLSYGGSSYEADGLNQMDPSASGSQWAYDEDGNLEDDATWDYEYDANDRLIRMSKPGKSLEFAYDYQGRRVEKKVWNSQSSSGTPATHLKFVYQGMELLAELDSGGDVDKSFHWGLDRSNTRGGAGGNMGLLMWRDHNASKSYFPSYDLSGNVAGLLDENGKYAAWYEHDPFGRVLTEGGAMKDANPIRFGTQYVDDETGLVYYGFRYYDPAKGRFIRRDPIAEEGGLNLYRFVDNNPVDNLDVHGLAYECDVSKAIHFGDGDWIGTDYYYTNCRFVDDSETPDVKAPGNNYGEGGGNSGGPDTEDPKDKPDVDCEEIAGRLSKYNDRITRLSNRLSRIERYTPLRNEKVVSQVAVDALSKAAERLGFSVGGLEPLSKAINDGSRFVKYRDVLKNISVIGGDNIPAAGALLDSVTLANQWLEHGSVNGKKVVDLAAGVASVGVVRGSLGALGKKIPYARLGLQCLVGKI